MAARRKSARIPLQASLRDVLRSVLRVRLKRLYAAMDEAVRIDDAETLHRMRVALRRLQAFLKIFKDCFPRKKSESYSKVLKELLQLSGNVREYDVFLAVVEEYRKPLTGTGGLVLDALIARKIRERRHAYKLLNRSLRELQSANFRAGLTDVVIGTL